MSSCVLQGDVEASMLLPTDLCVVADDGYTLLMIAAIYNRGNTLSHLLAKNKATIDAQHTKVCTAQLKELYTNSPYNYVIIKLKIL